MPSRNRNTKRIPVVDQDTPTMITCCYPFGNYRRSQHTYAPSPNTPIYRYSLLPRNLTLVSLRLLHHLHTTLRLDPASRVPVAEVDAGNLKFRNIRGPRTIQSALAELGINRRALASSGFNMAGFRFASELNFEFFRFDSVGVSHIPFCNDPVACAGILARIRGYFFFPDEDPDPAPERLWKSYLIEGLDDVPIGLLAPSREPRAAETAETAGKQEDATHACL